MATIAEVGRPSARPSKAVAAAARWFFFAMAIVMAGFVAYGFSLTVDNSLLRPKIARPPILWVHAFLMSVWLALFVVQTGLARARKVTWHRALGLWSLAIGIAIPLVGVPTAFVMRRFDIDHFHDHLNFIAVPLADMLLFSGFFAVAALNRRVPEIHRRAMFMATLSVIDAGIGRWPVPDAWFNAGWYGLVIDGLIVLAIVRDLVTIKRVHPVFAWGLPAMIAVQLASLWLWHHPPAPWLAFLRGIVGAG
jgi:hypothetical protein